MKTATLLSGILLKREQILIQSIKKASIDINNKINQKKRKILGYLPAEKLFLDELTKINVTENTIFYKN